MSDERVMVFIDGQNLVKALQRAHRARVHPILLGRHLAGDRSAAGIRQHHHRRLARP